MKKLEEVINKAEEFLESAEKNVKGNCSPSAHASIAIGYSLLAIAISLQQTKKK